MVVNYSNLQIAVVELTSWERVKIFSLIEHLLPLIQSLFKGIFVGGVVAVVAVMCLDCIIAMCSDAHSFSWLFDCHGPTPSFNHCQFVGGMVPLSIQS